MHSIDGFDPIRTDQKSRKVMVRVALMGLMRAEGFVISVLLQAPEFRALRTPITTGARSMHNFLTSKHTPAKTKWTRERFFTYCTAVPSVPIKRSIQLSKPNEVVMWTPKHWVLSAAAAPCDTAKSNDEVCTLTLVTARKFHAIARVGMQEGDRHDVMTLMIWCWCLSGVCTRGRVAWGALKSTLMLSRESCWSARREKICRECRSIPTYRRTVKFTYNMKLFHLMTNLKSSTDAVKRGAFSERPSKLVFDTIQKSLIHLLVDRTVSKTSIRKGCNPKYSPSPWRRCVCVLCHNLMST